MAAAPFPLVDIRSAASAQNEWVALLLRAAEGSFDSATLRTMFGELGLLAAVAPLDCIVLLDSPAVLTPPVLVLMPPHRVVLAVAAQGLREEGMARRLAGLQEDGYRVLIDGPLPDGVNAGFGRLSDTYGLDTALEGPDFGARDPGPHDDGTTRRRLLTMLALLARDADSCQLEAQLKQDPGLSYHLLKLVNSAAFSAGVPISSVGQAITRIGRRQLQRWLQLLLYARQQPDGPPNLLLPVAARRGATLEALCKRDGGNHDEQDLAFMTGVFSLLDRLFRTPMAELLRELSLPPDAEAALLAREGLLGQRLRLCEASRPDRHLLQAAGIDSLAWWQSQLHAYHWAIQVARNV
jgi:EAL and modified HD-GYP domain-containing signal transduction protein